MYDDEEINAIQSKVAPKYRVVAAIVIAILLNLCLLFLYRRHQKKKMNEEL
jgi:preprotein translocase subunit Sec61beta